MSSYSIMPQKRINQLVEDGSLEHVETVNHTVDGGCFTNLQEAGTAQMHARLDAEKELLKKVKDMNPDVISTPRGVPTPCVGTAVETVTTNIYKRTY